MTHLLFEEHPRRRNGYVLSALYYYTPDDINKENIRKILNKYYLKKIEHNKRLGYDDSDDEVILLKNKLAMLSLPDFLTKPKYIRVGKLDFQKIGQTSITIHDIDAWIMRAGSGLQMICSLLKIFLPNFNTIFLTPETPKADTYWRKLGFRSNNLGGEESHVNTNISSTILSKCVTLASNVELIIKKLDGTYTDNLEDVKNLVF